MKVGTVTVCGVCSLVLLVQIGVVICNPPDLYSCIDWDCEEWMSKGKTLLRYSGKTDKHLSFKKNEDILIISKPVNKDQPDWIGKVGKKTGLVPKDMIREDKVNKNPLKFKLLLHEILSKFEIEDDEAGDTVNEDTVNDIAIEDIGDNVSDSQAVAAEVTSSDSPKSEESIEASTTVNEVETSEATFTSSPALYSDSSLSEISSEEAGDISQTPDFDIVSDPVLEPISLQPSTDTVLQGTTTIDYLPETPKTVEQKPTDDITPRIPETVVLDSITSIQEATAVSGKESVHIEDFSVSRVEKLPSSEEETGISSATNEPHSQIPFTSESGTITYEKTKLEEKTSEAESATSEDLAKDVTVSPNQVENEASLEVPEAMAMEATQEVPIAATEASTQDVVPSASISEAHRLSTHNKAESLSDDEVDTERDKTDSLEDDNEYNDDDHISTTEETEDVTKTPESENHVESVESTTIASDHKSVDEPFVDSDEITKDEKLSEISNTIEPPKVEEEPLPEEETEATAISKDKDPQAQPVDEPTTVEDQTTEESRTDEVLDSTTDSSVSDHQESLEESSNAASNFNQDFPSESEKTTGSEESSLQKDTEETPGSLNPTDEDSSHTDEVVTEEPKAEIDYDASVTPAPDSHATDHKETQTVSDVELGDKTTTEEPASSTQSLDTPVDEKISDLPAGEEVINESHDEHHHHHHHHHHSHGSFKDINDTETSSLILVIKHISSTLLSFLPEHLQDTILDVDDALVFTGIIALTLVSICVPYFLIEGYMSVRPLKKKVVELNKSLWKVSAAYETQQEEFEIFKQKAIAHDEFKKRAEQSENDVVILKKLETKHREQITALKVQLKTQMKEAVDIRALIEKTLKDKKEVAEECEKYKGAYENAKEALVKAKEELNSFQTHAKSSALQLGVSSKNVGVLTAKITMLEQEAEDMKAQLNAENEKRKAVEIEKREVEQSKEAVQKELAEFKNICHQYETTVSGLNDEIGKLESELATLKETLGEDSPLVEVAEVQAKAAFAEKEAESLRTRLEGFIADSENLNGKLAETTNALEEARNEKEQTINRLQVLEAYFKEREEEYIKTIEQLQLKESVRDKGKEELIKMIEEKENVCKDMNERLEALKEEFEETKQQHRNEIRALEAKGHENWLSLCQAERKAQDARKEAELLRQRLTAMSKEKDDEDGDGLNGEVPMFPVLPHDLVPLPILDESPSYFGLGGDFIPPPPLPEGEEREPHRPPPLGGRLSPPFSDIDDNVLSPIGIGRREDDCTDGSSGSDSPRRSPIRGGWVNVQHERDGGQGRESTRLSRPSATSSPIQHGVNL